MELIKKHAVAITIFCLGLLLLESCSTQKRLQRSIEKHGIKESISFVGAKYPEYFRTDSVTVHDTIIRTDSIRIPGVDVSVSLRDSLDWLVHESDSLRIAVNTKTGKTRVVVEPRLIEVHDTIHIRTECPPIECPEVKKLGDNLRRDSSFPGWGWLIGVFFLGLYARKITRFIADRLVSFR